MNMLEIAAKAAYREWISGLECAHEKWEDLPESHRLRLIDSMRAALKAVADIPDCDFPRAVLTAGKIADEECSSIPHGIRAAFRAMLRETTELKSS